MTDYEARYDISDAQSDYIQYSRHDANRVITVWPAREQYVKGESRATRVDVVEIVVGTFVLGVCFLAIVAALFVATGAAA